MFEVDLCCIDKTWLKGRLQECVTDTDTGEVVAIFGDDRNMAEKIAKLLNNEMPIFDDKTGA